MGRQRGNDCVFAGCVAVVGLILIFWWNVVLEKKNPGRKFLPGFYLLT